MVLLEVKPEVDSGRICKDIFEYCDANVEERGKPVAVVVLSEIPLTGMGKNHYRLLEKHFQNFDYTAWSPGLYN